MDGIEKQDRAQDKLKKKTWPLLVLTLLMFVAIGMLLFAIVEYNVKLVTFKGEQQIMIGVTPENFTDMYDNLTITFTDNGEQMSYTYNNLGIQVQWTDEQKHLFDSFVVDLDSMQVLFNYPQELQNIIQELNNDRKDWMSAVFKETENDFILVKEQEGNKVDIDAIEEYIISNLTTEKLVVNLDYFKYAQPEDFITTEKYNEEFSKWSSFCIIYSNGFVITTDDIKPFFALTEDYKIVFKEEMRGSLKEEVQGWVNNDLQNYNTLGGTFKFLTHAGEEVELKGVNYGDMIDKQKEVEFLVATIEKLQSCSQRIPEMSIDYPDDIQNNTIEISIEDQHLWCWKNGQVVMETDVVTGWKNKWDTPKGVYQVLNKINGTYLVGADYEVWVDKWIRFWNGYGLHDAMWRNEFGSSVYMRDGSHGCINLPHSFAVEIYDMIEVENCIVIY